MRTISNYHLRQAIKSENIDDVKAHILLAQISLNKGFRDLYDKTCKQQGIKSALILTNKAGNKYIKLISLI